MTVVFRIVPFDGHQFGLADSISVAVDNLSPPQLVSYQPADSILISWRLDAIPLTFNRAIDVNSVGDGIVVSYCWVCGYHRDNQISINKHYSHNSAKNQKYFIFLAPC